MGTGRVAAVGEWARIRGFALAGVETVPAEDPDAVRTAWSTLEQQDVAVVILTRSAAEALGESIRRGPLTVVLPP